MRYLAALLMVFLLVGSSGAQEVSGDIGVEYGFQWQANSEPDLAGYRLYRSTTSGGQTFGAAYAFKSFGLVTESPHYTENIPGTYYFVLTAFDTEGHESGPSDEQRLIVIDEAPEAPKGCTVIKF